MERTSVSNGLRVVYDLSIFMHCTLLHRASSAPLMTLAGNGLLQAPKFADGPGSAAYFNGLYGVAVSADGAFALVADSGNNRVRRVDIASGQVTTMAGSADGSTDGIGTMAAFSEPRGIAISSDGLFALVTEWSKLRRIEIATRRVTTLAGSASGSVSGSADGLGTMARFNQPMGVAISSDGAFALVADSSDNRVRRIEIATGNVTTLAGSVQGFRDGTGSQAKFHTPNQVAISRDGVFALVSDKDNYRVRRVEISSGLVTTLAGSAQGFNDGVGVMARFNSLAGVAISNDGVFALVADYNCVRRIEIATGNVTTLAGKDYGFLDGTGTVAKFRTPTGVSISSNGAFALVTDSVNNRLRRVEVASGVVTTLAGAVFGFKDGAGTMVSFGSPWGIAISNNASLAIMTDSYQDWYVQDSDANSVRRIDMATGQVTTLATGSKGVSSGSPQLSISDIYSPTGVAISADGAFALVADSQHNRLCRIQIATGNVTTLAGSVYGSEDGLGTMAQFSSPSGVAISSDGVFALVADSSYANRVRRVEIGTGNVTTLAGSFQGFAEGTGTAAKFNRPMGLAISSDGSFALVADKGNNRVRRIDIATGNVTTLAGSDAGFADDTGPFAEFRGPTGVAISSDGSFALVADQNNNLLRIVEIATGRVTTLAASSLPTGVAISSDGAFVLVAGAGGYDDDGSFGGSVRRALLAAPCSPGFYCVNGSSTPTQFACDAGFYCNATGLSSSATQLPCQAAYYCPGGSSSATQSACSVGDFCPAGTKAPAPCPADFYCPDPSRAIQCASTQSCPAGSSSPSLSALMIALIVVGALAVCGGGAWLVRRSSFGSAKSMSLAPSSVFDVPPPAADVADVDDRYTRLLDLDSSATAVAPSAHPAAAIPASAFSATAFPASAPLARARPAPVIAEPAVPASAFLARERPEQAIALQAIPASASLASARPAQAIAEEATPFEPGEPGEEPRFSSESMPQEFRKQNRSGKVWGNQ